MRKQRSRLVPRPILRLELLVEGTVDEMDSISDRIQAVVDALDAEEGKLREPFIMVHPVSRRDWRRAVERIRPSLPTWSPWIAPTAPAEET